MQPLTQVHLDFHTSEHIPDVGSRFDPARFQQVLTEAGVGAINLFAKCHHSWSYYPTTIGCGTHPTLQIDLLGQQVAACHEVGIRCPIYYTVGWSANDAKRHPDWCVRNRDGTIRWSTGVPAGMNPDTPLPPVCWQFLCPSGEYRKLMLEQVAEILDRFPIDGLWFDICNLEPCWCERCRSGMREQKLDDADDDDVARYTTAKWESFMKACRQLVGDAFPDASVFFNGLCHPTTPEVIHAQQTHFELEDLPTTWGGYDKLPGRARYFRRYGKSLVAMSGKFHTMWGEFGGFKHPDAIKAEAFAMAVEGAACNFGDQLHPSGEIDSTTYRNLAPAFAAVRRIEPFLRGAEPTANLGVFFGQRPTGRPVHGTSANVDDEGVCTMLLEGHIDFDVAQRGGDWSSFETLVFTGPRCLDDNDAEAVQTFIDGGGRVVLLGDSPLSVESEKPLFDIGGEYVGTAEKEVDYTALGPELLESVGPWAASPFLNYEAACRLIPTDGQVLAGIHEPYFNRTLGSYCSHQNTPPEHELSSHVAALEKGPILTLPHRLGRLYLGHGARIHRELFLAGVRRMHRRPVLEVSGLPSTARTTLRYQPHESRWVLHLLHAPPVTRGRCQVLEDFPVNRGVRAIVELPDVKAIVAEDDGGQQLPVEPVGERWEIALPPWSMHQLITIRSR